MKRDAFSQSHPAVNFVFLVGAIGFGVVIQHPAYAAAGCMFAALYYLLLRGRSAWKMILSVLPLFIGVAVGGDDLLIVAMVDLLLLMVGAGVYMLIRSGVIWASYNKLLEEGEYTREEKAGKSVAGAISTAYWLVMVAIYLALSLPQDRWDRSWILWPVAGVLYAVVRIIAAGVARGRK